MIEVGRDSIVDDVLKAYELEEIIAKTVKIVFRDKEGIDAGGLTSDFFSEFWNGVLNKYFEGEDISYPIVSSCNLWERMALFKKLSLIVCHQLQLTKEPPPRLGSVFLCSVFFQGLAVTDDMLKDNFLYSLAI